MEASAAALGAGQADGGVAQDGGDANGQGIDFGSVVDQLGTMAQSHEEMRALLQNLPEQLRALPLGDHALDGDPSDYYSELDATGLDAGADPGDVFDAHAAAGELDQALGGLVQQTVQPLAQELSRLRADHADLRETHEAERLLNEFPEAGENPEQLMGLTRQVAAMVGAQPNFQLARLVYMASKAAEVRQQEIEDQERQELDGGPPGAARLEGGGGSAGFGGRGDSLTQQILGAGQSSVLPFP